MKIIDAAEFAYRLNFSHFDLATWIWAILFFVLSRSVLGLFWGMMWNRKWAFIGHTPSAVVSHLFALVLGTVALGWFGANRSSTWIEEQREVLTSQLANSDAINREALKEAWNKLQPVGGQKDIVAPDEGGNELRLNSEQEAKVLANCAAAAIETPLLRAGPFAFGAPCYVRDPATVAEDVVAAVTPPTYPVIVSPANEWTKAAITNQVSTAIGSANRSLSTPLQSFKTALLWLGLLVLVIQVVFIPICALNDIKEKPQVITSQT
jgi:hypothetical protein